MASLVLNDRNLVALSIKVMILLSKFYLGLIFGSVLYESRLVSCLKKIHVFLSRNYEKRSRKYMYEKIKS